MKLIGVSDDQAGFHVGPAGDLDGDGVQDVIVGAFQAPTNGPGQGGLHLVYGPVTPGSICLRQDADARLLGELTGAFAAEGFAGVGDLGRRRVRRLRYSGRLVAFSPTFPGCRPRRDLSYKNLVVLTGPADPIQALDVNSNDLICAFDKTYRDDPCAQDVLDQLAEQKSN